MLHTRLWAGSNNIGPVTKSCEKYRRNDVVYELHYYHIYGSDKYTFQGVITLKLLTIVKRYASLQKQELLQLPGSRLSRCRPIKSNLRSMLSVKSKLSKTHCLIQCGNFISDLPRSFQLATHHLEGAYNDSGSFLLASLLDGNTLGLPLNSTLRALSTDNGTDSSKESTILDFARNSFLAVAERKVLNKLVKVILWTRLLMKNVSTYTKSLISVWTVCGLHLVKHNA